MQGRGATDNPSNRFDRLVYEPDAESLEERSLPDTQVFHDKSRSLITHNDSPDVGFDSSINPYRGCEHGCIYCYARPTHEYLGLSAGLDFETRIFAKMEAPNLLRQELASSRWKPQPLDQWRDRSLPASGAPAATDSRLPGSLGRLSQSRSSYHKESSGNPRHRSARNARAASRSRSVCFHHDAGWQSCWKNGTACLSSRTAAGRHRDSNKVGNPSRRDGGAPDTWPHRP